MIDPGAYDIESTLETITLLCEQSGEPCDGARFRELILKARDFLAARRTVSGQEAPTAEQVERAFLSQSTWTTIGYAVNWEDFQYLIAKLFAAPIPATEPSHTEKDAARYRFLRSRLKSHNILDGVQFETWFENEVHDLDTAIDAASEPPHEQT